MINLPFNTVLMLIGPSNSGKSTLVERLKKDPPTGGYINTVFVSSDECRREILGANYQKYDERMLQASNEAFKLLFTKMRASMSFPMSLSNGLIILDTTGLNETFRNQVSNLCREMNWNLAGLVFDYKDGLDEYRKFVPEDLFDAKITSNHLKRLRTKVRPTLRKKDFNAGVFTIKEKTSKFENVQIQLDESSVTAKSYSIGRKHFGEDALVIGDVHGCYEELVQLLKKANFDVQGNLIIPTEESPSYVVLVGDLVDKGPHSDKVIDLVHANLYSGVLYLVIGNHDYNFVQIVDGLKEVEEEKRSRWYDASYSLEHDEDRKRKMRDIVRRSKPYFHAPHFVATHCPCPVKYIGKTDDKSFMRQVELRYPHPKEDETQEEFSLRVEKSLKFMKDQEVMNWPYLISGHIAVDKITRLGTQFMIDTGAVYGNGLSGLILEPEAKPEYISVPSKPYCEERFLPSIFKRDPMKDVELSLTEKRRIRAMTSDCPVNFLSGTMAPAKSNVESNILEDLDEALKYYRDAGVEEIVLQPKFMGSHAQIVMVRGKAPNSRPGVYQVGDTYCYWISRNGYLFKSPDLSELSKTSVDKWFDDDTDLLILDGELLPWSVLGEGLINKTFTPVQHGIESLIEELSSISYDQELEHLYASAAKSGYLEDRKLSKKERAKKYKSYMVNTYESMLYLRRELPSLDEMKANLNIYKKQLRLHGSGGIPDFKPFSILKWIKKGKEEVLPGDNWNDFIKLTANERDTCIKLSSENSRLAQVFFKHYESMDYEGIVVKPFDNKLSNVAPAIKVRNENYLTLVYGPNYRFGHLYDKHVQGKRIGGKLKASIKQWQLALEMLNISYYQISSSKRAEEIIFSFIGEQRKSEALDPRV